MRSYTKRAGSTVGTVRGVNGSESSILEVVRGLSEEPGFALAAVQALFEVRPMSRGGIDRRSSWNEEKDLQDAIMGLAEVYYVNSDDVAACRLIAEGVERYGPTRTTALCIELAVLCGMPRPHENLFTPYAVVELQWYLPPVLEPQEWAREALDVWYRSIVKLVRSTEEESGTDSAAVLAERCSHVLAVCEDPVTRKYLRKLQRHHHRTHRLGLIDRWWMSPEKRLRRRGYSQRSGSGRAIPADIAWIVRFHHAYSVFIDQYEAELSSNVPVAAT